MAHVQGAEFLRPRRQSHERIDFAGGEEDAFGSCLKSMTHSRSFEGSKIPTLAAIIGSMVREPSAGQAAHTLLPFSSTTLRMNSCARSSKQRMHSGQHDRRNAGIH